MDDTSSKSARHLVIVGGGTAGWMTAALLGHHLTERDCRITVIDQDDGGIGVGEATIPSVLRLLQTLGADESDFMRACNATWKLAIQFSDWQKTDHCSWHPFGVCGAKIDERDLFPFWLMGLTDPEEQKRPYHAYSLHWAAALAGKSPHAKTVQSPITATGSYAFHLDSGRFANWLKQQALASGVNHVVGTVTAGTKNDAGDVSSVVLVDGTEVTGEFFVDCSGFESVLLNKTLGDPWISWGDRLLCDRAVVTRLPARSVVPNFTQSKALTSGWMWDIPLMDRRGVGYVYSSQHLSDDAAWQELQTAIEATDQKELVPKFVSMKVGRQTQFWNRNVLAIGLSAGFVEPLESSGLHLTQVAVERFLELFPTDNASSTPLRNDFNTSMTNVFDQVRDYVQLHYTLNERDDDFWKAAAEQPVSSELQHRLKLYDENGTFHNLHPEAFPDTSYYHLLAGHGRLPKRPPAMALAVDRERLRFVMQAIRDQNRGALRDLPLHEEALKLVHTETLAKAS